jgi:hypothetical protein
MSESKAPAPVRTGAGAVVDRAEQPRHYRTAANPATIARIPITPCRELRVEIVDGHGIVLSEREHRAEALDLPHVVAIAISAEHLDRVIAALERARAARR